VVLGGLFRLEVKSFVKLRGRPLAPLYMSQLLFVNLGYGSSACPAFGQRVLRLVACDPSTSLKVEDKGTVALGGCHQQNGCFVSPAYHPPRLCSLPSKASPSLICLCAYN
jgi:hypothetical protein